MYVIKVRSYNVSIIIFYSYDIKYNIVLPDGR